MVGTGKHGHEMGEHTIPMRPGLVSVLGDICIGITEEPLGR